MAGEITMAVARTAGLAASVPKLRGRMQADAALAPFTWFRVGGTAEVLARPADAGDLADFLRDLPHEVPVHVIGACSNLIVRDGGLPGVTIRLARGFSSIKVEAGGIVAGAGAGIIAGAGAGIVAGAGAGIIAGAGAGIIAGAAALDVTVAEHAAAAELTGLEFLSGIPGSIGGAVAMNAGAYGGDMATVLDWAEVVTRTGEQRRLLGPQLAFAYRHAALPAGAVVTRVRLRGIPSAAALVAARMAAIKAAREASQPVRARTGGSTFRNPDGMQAWELIDNAGCRGLVLGGAMVSEKHCNFLINTGSATAADLEALGEAVRRRVLAATGVSLEWEIRRIGVPAAKPEVAPDGSPGGLAGGAPAGAPAGAPGEAPPGLAGGGRQRGRAGAPPSAAASPPGGRK